MTIRPSDERLFAPGHAMRCLSLAAFFALAACGGGAPEPEAVIADPATVRTLAQGDLIGFSSEDGAHVWRGIPFVKAPIGALRWRAPRPPEAWDGQLEALDFGPACPQVTNALDQGEGLAPEILRGEEDCLHLNIYAPQDAGQGASLPVMVWIHGGGNVWGRAAQFDGSRLAATQNVIVVTIQYRLGPLGWFAHGAIRDDAQTPEDRSANFATLDMIASLEWVRDNIAAFGGDASRVTIFGESAGGHDVASLIASPLAEGLFHRAIIQSGSFRSVPLAVAEGLEGAYPNAARPAAEAMLRAAGREGPVEDAALPQALRALSVEQVFAPYRANSSGGLIGLPLVVSDGIAIPSDGMRAAVTRPGFNAVPIMSGTTRDETKLFNFLDPSYVSSLFGLQYWPKDRAYYDLVAEYQSVVWRVRGVDDPFARMAGAGHDDLYAYRFDWDEEANFLFTDFSQLVGAAHAMEIPFVFGRFRFFGETGDQFFFTDGNKAGREAVSDAMMAYWAGFARTGVPQGEGRPDWPTYGDGAVMVFDTPQDGGVRMISSTETLQGVLDRLAADERIETMDERCRVLKAVMDFHPEVGIQRSQFLGGACLKE